MQNLVDFETILTERLKDPERKKGVEIETKKVKLELLINDILQETGNEEYCVSLVEVENY